MAVCSTETQKRPRKRVKKGTREFQAYCAYLAITPWHKLFTPDIIANFPVLCKRKDVNCSGILRDPALTTTFIFRFAVDLYNHVQRTPFYANKCGDRSDDLAWFINRVNLDQPAIPAWAIQKDPTRRTARTEAWMNKLRASIPATSPYPADLRLADLHEFEDTWYCAITIMQDLYEDVRVRMNSGFIKWDEIVHSFGKMGSSPNEPCHVYDLLEFCWMMWFYNNESDFVFTLNEAVKHRNKRDLGVASGLIDVNRQPSSITFDMLYRKHKLDRYAESERDEDRTLGEIRVALDEELWIRRMYGHEAEQRYPLNTVNTPKSAGVNTEATGTPRSATAPDLRTANASNDSKHTVVNKDAAEPTAPRRSATTSQLSPQRRRNGANGATPQRTQEDPIAADPMEIDPIETKAATTQIPAKPALNLNKPLPAIPSPKPKPSRIFKSATKAFKLRGNPLKIFTSHPKPALSSPLSSPTDSIPLTPTTASSSATASTISTTPNTSPAAFDIAALPATKPCIRQSCYPTSPLSPVQEMVREEAEGEEGIEPDEVRREREMREDYVLPRTVYVPPEGWKKEWNW